MLEVWDTETGTITTLRRVQSSPMKPTPSLRLWPGLLIVTLQWVMAFLVPRLVPEAEWFGLEIAIVGLMASVLGGLAILVWWLFFSRARWSERIGALVLLVVALIGTRLLAHPSIAGAGMGVLLFLEAVPWWSLALVVGAAVANRLAGAQRFQVIAVAIVLSCVPWTMLRTAGVTSTGSEYHWRWAPTPEAVMLAGGDDIPSVAPLAAVEMPADEPAVPATPVAAADPTLISVPMPVTSTSLMPIEWPGFRGSARDGVVRGVRIGTDWSSAPPVELWRRPIGPGWSSFAVQGDLLYTQEQRGDAELVSCYRVSTGEPVWGHRDAVRFWESNAGAGPRATPTLHEGRLYALGATGILNALDATTGALQWSRHVATEIGQDLPIWGFSGSPQIFGDVVVVAMAGTLAAYDIATGAHRWTGPASGNGYSSPHRVVLDGVEQVVLLGGPGAMGVAPNDGTVLWTQEWESAIVQPAVTDDGDILINAVAPTGGLGIRRLGLTRTGGTWTLEERWTSIGLKPYFNDFVVHKGHAYGFDGSILSAIDLRDGRRVWKGGRFGNGQMILLAEQDLLLVISEDGELALVSATPDQFTEVSRFPALDGKTWNHPVVVGDMLLVRNGQEMAAFRLPLPAR